MTLNANELFSENERAAPLRIFPTYSQPKKFSSGSGTVAKGSVVAYNTSTNDWELWTNGGSNGTGDMQGIVWPDDITLDSDEEVLGMVMLNGEVHRDDIPLNGETQANLDAELRDNARALGIHVQGLPGAH